MRVSSIKEEPLCLHDLMAEFISCKQAQKARERTVRDYRKYFDAFLKGSSDSLQMDVLKDELIVFFKEIPDTSPAIFNHPYQYLHALFAWAVKQDYLQCNPFDKLDLKKRRDEGNIHPATIQDIQAFLKCMDKSNYCDLRDYTITMLLLDTGMRTSEILALRHMDYFPEDSSILIRPDVSKTNRGRTVYLSAVTNNLLKKFIKLKPKEWEDWLFPTRDGLQLQSNVLGRNFRKYCKRSGVQFTPYQLRHSFATFYLQNGGDLFTLQRLMGHTDLQMTRRYTEISDQQANKAHKVYSPVGLLESNTRKIKV